MGGLIMLKKILAMTLAVLMITSSLVVNFADPGNGKANGLENGNGNNGQGNAFGYGHGGYDDEPSRYVYYYGNGTDFDKLDENSKGKLMVQYYDVSDISWKSNSSRDLWNRTNMFSENRVIDTPVMVEAIENNGYGDYYDGYIFYKNGTYTEGPISKTAQRIWGYYKPNRTGWYKFRVTSDDGHYFKMFNDDIYNSPHYDHYNNGTYANQWNRFYNNGELELDNMIVTSNVQEKTDWRYMRTDEIYPVYMEYFNWGGSGKFYIEETYQHDNQFTKVAQDKFYAAIAGEPIPESNSGIDVTVENGIRRVHAYDDFDDGSISDLVWADVNRFNEFDGTLNSLSGLASIQLKNEYAEYDAYKIQVSLVNIDDQTKKYSNGGIGITEGNSIWVNQLQVTQKSDRKWYRYFDVTKYGTVSSQLPNGERYKDAWFNKNNNGKKSWRNKSLKMVVDAEKLPNGEGYDVTVSIYEIKNNDFKLLTTVNTTTEDSNLDFNKIYLADIMPYGGWSVSFDDFDFVAVKDTRFTSLNVSHKDDDYILDWEAIEGAQKYVVYYGNDENSVGTKYGGDIDASTTSLAIPDDLSGYNSKYFKVVAVISDKEIGSNTVKLNGNISMSVLQGEFDASDYLLTWDKLNGADKYQLYYGDTPTAIETLLPDSGDMNSNTISKRLENMESTSPYYNKYFQLRAIDGDITYYSNAIKVEDNLRLGLEYKEDNYYLKWVSDATFTSYDIYYGDSETTITTLYENKGRDDRESKISDTSVLKNKYFTVVGKSGSRRVISNHVKLIDDITIAPLEWTLLEDGTQSLSWGSFDQPEMMTLYYGETLDAMTSVMSNPENLPNGTVTYTTKDSEYLNKFIQLKFVKNGISYYTNIVRSAQFSDATATVKANNDRDKKDLLIEWANDPIALGYEIRYRKPGSTDGGVLIIGDLPAGTSSYNIEDIYGLNKDYLNKEIIVIAKYGDGVEVSSQPVIAKEVVFDSFEGNLKTSSVFEMSWDAPGVTVNGQEEDAVVSYYTIKYGANIQVDTTVESAGALEALNYTISDVSNDSSSAGYDYYEKYFTVYAMIDDIAYESNVIKSLPENILTVSHVNGDYVLDWNKVKSAVSYKVIYGDDELDLNKQYEGVLSSDDLTKVISDLKDVSDKYFRVLAVLGDGTEIPSNVVKLLGDQTMSTLTGVVNGTDYDLSWTAFDSPESYKLVYMDKINGVETEVVTADPLTNSTLVGVIENLKATVYNDKFIRLIAKKGEIEFKSNVIRASQFTEAYGHVTLDNAGDETKKDFDFKWSLIPGAKDYIVYYKDSTGVEKVYPEDFSDESHHITTIKDIEASVYNGMTFRVEAVFDGDVRVTSGTVSHDSSISTKLTSVFNTENDDYTLNWTGVGSENDYNFRIVYHDDAPIVDALATKMELLNKTQLTKVFNNVVEGSSYYQKYFKVQVIKDGVYYDSNTVFATNTPILNMEKFSDDYYNLYWDKIEGADSLKLEYSDDFSNDNVLDEILLSSLKTNHELSKILSENKVYDNKYFRLSAEFNGFELKSNEVKLTSTIAKPIISGTYNNDTFNISWNEIPGATSIEVILIEKDANGVITSRSVIEKIPGSRTNYMINSVFSSGYLDKEVQIKVIYNNSDDSSEFAVYSNDITVKDPVVSGHNPEGGGGSGREDLPSIDKGDFNTDGDIVKLRMGNEFEVDYRFTVNKNMYNPYFKVTLTGNEYLSYDKIIAGLYNVDTEEKIPVRLVMDVDESTGDIVVYVHPRGESAGLLKVGEYKVTLDTTIDVINEKAVYDALDNLPSYYEGEEAIPKPKRWELPYHISKLKDDDIKLDHDMLIKYEVEWNSSADTTSSDIRQNNQELFELDVQVKDKRKLPNSI